MKYPIKMNQDDFILKIIKDIHYEDKENKSIRNYKDVRLAVFECPECNKYFKLNIKAKATKTTKQCPSCNTLEIQNTIKSHNKKTSLENLQTIFRGMKERCYLKTSRAYKNYGGRGITVCNEWLDDKNNFINWSLLNGYSDLLSIDRINNDKGYSPKNCRYVNRNIQARNTRKIMLTNTSGYRGVSKKGNKWSSSIRIKYILYTLGNWNTPLEAAKAYDYFILKNNLEHTINNVLKKNEPIDIASKLRIKNRLFTSIFTL